MHISVWFEFSHEINRCLLTTNVEFVRGRQIIECEAFDIFAPASAFSKESSNVP